VAAMQYTFTHKQYKKRHNGNRIYRTYITLRIQNITIRAHEHNKKFKIYTFKPKHTNTHPYVQLKESEAKEHEKM
jgi:hypothetical protein